MAKTTIDGTRQITPSTITNASQNFGTPSASTDVAIKSYVDGLIQGLDIKASVRVATVVAGTLATSFANGQVVDGVTLVTGDRILLKNQATGSENGIYTVNVSGAPTRATDADTSAKVTAGMYCFVTEGTTLADTGWVCTTNDAIVLNTTALAFSQFSSAGAGLSTTNFVKRETPTGTINGSNVTFTLANTPTAGTEEVYLNGIQQESGAGNDYTISGGTITYLTAPIAGDKIRVSYMK
jgi:phage-related tail fiber protein